RRGVFRGLARLVPGLFHRHHGNIGCVQITAEGRDLNFAGLLQNFPRHGALVVVIQQLGVTAENRSDGPGPLVRTKDETGPHIVFGPRNDCVFVRSGNPLVIQQKSKGDHAISPSSLVIPEAGVAIRCASSAILRRCSSSNWSASPLRVSSFLVMYSSS